MDASPQGTLGHVLYSGSSQPLISEKNWLRLVRAIATGDQAALHILFERTNRLVFTLLVRLTSDRATAEELTLEVYEEVWKYAASYGPKENTVLAWLMNRARKRAIDHLRAAQSAVRTAAGLITIDAPDYRHVMQFKEQSRALRSALAALPLEELTAIEAAFFSGHTIAEAAERLRQSPQALRAHICRGLRTLRQALSRPASSPPRNNCAQAELVCTHALGALTPLETAVVETHLPSCWQCRRELEALRPVVDSFVGWPIDILRPSPALQARLVERLAALTGRATPAPAPERALPEWENVARGISCRLLANDTEKHMVSMLVRLVPGGEYPAHTHAGLEELHLLDGELWIDDHKLHPGDYNRAEPGTGDKRVWSETGCSCVLVTSTRDILV